MGVDAHRRPSKSARAKSRPRSHGNCTRDRSAAAAHGYAEKKRQNQARGGKEPVEMKQRNRTEETARWIKPSSTTDSGGGHSDTRVSDEPCTIRYFRRVLRREIGESAVYLHRIPAYSAIRYFFFFFFFESEGVPPEPLSYSVGDLSVVLALSVWQGVSPISKGASTLTGSRHFTRRHSGRGWINDRPVE